jgi:hypothetical protein
MGHSVSIGPASVGCCASHSGYIFWSALGRRFCMRKDALHLTPHAEGVVIPPLMGLHDARQDLRTCILQPMLLNERRGNTLRIVFHERPPPVSLRQPPQPVCRQ